MKPKDSIDYHIKVCWHAISRMYNQQAIKFDMTTSIGFVLLNIDSQDGTQATKIAPLMGLEARSLTRMLKSMEKKGLLYKEQDPYDGRSVRIFLTPEGKAKKEIAKQTVKTFNRVVKNTIPANKLNVLFEVIQEINHLIDDNLIFKPAQNSVQK